MDFSELLSYLPPERRESVLCFETLGSTNTYIKSIADAAPEGLVVLASSQTAGRGRHGRSFLSPEGGVYLSMLLRPRAEPEEAARLTAWAAVAVSDAVERVCLVRPEIKWVNDLLLGGKKICGILSEMAFDERGAVRYAVVGVGVNVNTPKSAFGGELSSIATSISAETGRTHSAERLAAEIIASLDALRRSFPHERAEYLSAYRRGCATVGREIAFFAGGERRAAFAEEVGADFELRVRFPDGTAGALRGGEVSVRGLAGGF